MTADWAPTDRHFARWCRWLLLAYPGHYRRRHGPEIITTMLDMRPPERRRPGVAEVTHLLASGVRQRFRVPAGRPLALVAAVLVALTTGAFGAAAGSWTGAQTFATVPDDATIVGLAQRATGVGGQADPSRHASSWMHDSVFTSTEIAGRWDVEQARQRLAADGWAVSGVTTRDGVAAYYDPDANVTVEIPLPGFEFTARAHGVTTTVTGHGHEMPGRPGDLRSGVTVDGWADSTPWFLPLIVVGTVTGLIGGWLIGAAGAYRLRRTSVGRRRAAAGLSAVAVLTLALPSVALYGNVMRAFRYHGDHGPVRTVHSALTPGGYYPFGPEWQVLALTVAGAVMGAAVLLLARPAAEPQTQQTPVAG